jgi:hypothetical protein
VVSNYVYRSGTVQYLVAIAMALAGSDTGGIMDHIVSCSSWWHPGLGLPLHYRIAFVTPGVAPPFASTKSLGFELPPISIRGAKAAPIRSPFYGTGRRYCSLSG